MSFNIFGEDISKDFDNCYISQLWQSDFLLPRHLVTDIQQEEMSKEFRLAGLLGKIEEFVSGNVNVYSERKKKMEELENAIVEARRKKVNVQKSCNFYACWGMHQKEIEQILKEMYFLNHVWLFRYYACSLCNLQSFHRITRFLIFYIQLMTNIIDILLTFLKIREYFCAGKTKHTYKPCLRTLENLFKLFRKKYHEDGHALC